MSVIRVANEHISIDLQLGSEQDPVPSGGIEVPGIKIRSIFDVKNGYNYLQAPTSLFEFTVNNAVDIDKPADRKPTRSQDIFVTKLTVLHPDETITVFADAPDRKLSFELVLRSNRDDADPVIILSLTVTNHRDESIFLRSVFPKIYGFHTSENHLKDAVGMVSMEIGSVVPLQPLSDEPRKPDDLDHTLNPNTMGMPYRKWAKRIGLPTSMNTMELASIYGPKGGGGLFFADIGRPGVSPNQFSAPIQFTLSKDGVDGFWIAEVPPSQAVDFPQLAIGVHHEGDWHKPVDYYVEKHRGRWTFPEAPAWFRDQGAIYTFAGGGAGGIYLELAPENLPNGAIWTFFKNDNPNPWPRTPPTDPDHTHPWLPYGPIPLTKAQLAPPGASTAAIARQGKDEDVKDEDVFVVGNDGSIWWTFMRDNGPWQPAQPITEPHFAKPGGHLAAVARNDLQIDVFVVKDEDRALWTLFKVGDDQAEWDRTKLSEGDIAPSGAAIAAITRHGRDVDVFLIGMVGELRWTRERNNMPWLETPERITEEDFALPGGNLAALARNPSQTDVFVVNLQRQIATVFKTEARDDAPWEILSLDKPLAKSGAGIAAVVRNKKDEDVFVVGEKGAIYHASMRDNGGWSQPEPIRAIVESPPFKVTPEGAGIVAFAGNDGPGDVYVIDGDGNLRVAFKNQEDNKPNEWIFRPLAIAGAAPPGSGISAVARNDSQEDVFVVFQGRLSSFTDLPELLREAKLLGTNIVYLWDYWEGAPVVAQDAVFPGHTVPERPPYFNKGDYMPRADLGGEQALIEGIQEIHEQGGKIILYVEPFIIFKDSFVARFRPDPKKDTQGEYLAGRHPNTMPLKVIADIKDIDESGKGKPWEVYASWDKTYTMVPAFEEWQDHVIAVVERLVNQYGADGVLLDSFGWQMNYPMSVAYLGPDGEKKKQYWPIDYSRGVLDLADRVREVIGPERVVLVETPSGPMGRHCHGGLSADFGFHKKEGLSNQTRITASPVRYGIPEIRYFSNGKNLNELQQIYAAGHGLALCHQHTTEEGHAADIKKLVDIRKVYKDALIEGKQRYQPQPDTGSEAVAAYYYEGEQNELITIVNTSEEKTYSGHLRLAPEHADSTWKELWPDPGELFQANGIKLSVALPKVGLRVLLRAPDTLLALRNVGIDFSVSEARLRRWLNDREFTPYPALAGALLKLLEGKRLRQPVALDVIVFNYEHAPGASSPRRVEDVDFDLLRAAVVEGYNERYGEAVRDFQTLVR